MTPLYTFEQFDKAIYKQELPLKCKHCTKVFFRQKRLIKIALSPNQNASIDFCSKECQTSSQITKLQVICSNCSKTFNKHQNQINKSPKHFCSRSCSATYNNKNKTIGTRRSKLEIWLESQLQLLYPDIEFHFNKKDAIGSELDIYIPALSLAFELNGIFHYEPIYGTRKLGQIQVNDQNKYKACLDHQIDLCIVDTSALINFKIEKAQIYLEIINNIIKERFVDPMGLEPISPAQRRSSNH